MQQNKRIIVLTVFLSLTLTSLALTCTTAIVSGKGTVDGRPLLLKHRDSGFLQNRLIFSSDGKYDYIGLVNSLDTEGEEVWSGANSTGFAIMNSASYNLNDGDTTSLKDREGIIMKAALQSCATLEDFEKLLDQWPKPMGVEANFGVIDARGGAAYYETSNFSYQKIDVNDPLVAPFGYVIRTNYSFSGSEDNGYGYIRYLTAENLFYRAAAEHRIDHRFLLQNISRSLQHSLQHIDLTTTQHLSSSQPKYVAFQDYIPRNSSVTTMVVQGVKENESADLTTIWTILGFPLTSVVFPTWLAGGDQLPELLQADQTGNAPLCRKSLKLKRQCFPIVRGSGKKYINLSALINDENSGILQNLLSLEDQIIDLTDRDLVKWRNSAMEKNAVQQLYQTINTLITNEYQRLFGL